MILKEHQEYLDTCMHIFFMYILYMVIAGHPSLPNHDAFRNAESESCCRTIAKHICMIFDKIYLFRLAIFSVAYIWQFTTEFSHELINCSSIASKNNSWSWMKRRKKWQAKGLTKTLQTVCQFDLEMHWAIELKIEMTVIIEI